VQTAYNSSQQELEDLQAAALEICQEVEEGVVQARSSLASRLRALGGHVYQRISRTLHLVRTMCGSRTGGWSLPCMMSD
jgi:hypothetical protein